MSSVPGMSIVSGGSAVAAKMAMPLMRESKKYVPSLGSLTDTTRSPAVAERPRDASCLSVVSFNSTIHRAQSFIISYFGFRFADV